MARSIQDRSAKTLPPFKGPHPSIIKIAKSFLSEQQIQQHMATLGINPAQEEVVRLQVITCIDSIRKALQLPARTYSIACVYYQKFRLIHPSNEHDWRDAAVAALLIACKIEDTIKKSRDILCAAHNLRVPPSEHVSPDAPHLVAHAQNIMSVERMMLEASSFDFRSRYPQELLVKICKRCDLERDPVGVHAFRICLDIYKTLAPLKQTSQSMAIACMELATRLCGGVELAPLIANGTLDYAKLQTTRPEVMETLLDLLDLYTHHRLSTYIGLDYPLDKFISIRIALNQEVNAKALPRYTYWTDPAQAAAAAERSGESDVVGTPSIPTNGASVTASPTTSPHENGSVNGRDSHTIRFIFDPAIGKEEKRIVDQYFRTAPEYEDVVEYA